MKKIFNYVLVACGLYFGVNWIADNPKAIRFARNKMNETVDRGIEEVKRQTN